MKKKKIVSNNIKGFTLIELLAIIVILAIIAVITIPILLNVIENSRKGAAIDSAYGFKDSINKYYITKLADDRQFQLEGKYTFENGKLSGPNINTTGGDDIHLSGTVPSSGTLTYENNVLKSGCLVIGEYAVAFNDDGSTNTRKGECPAPYGYKSYGDTDISTSRPTNKNAYLKYILTNGELATGTVPETCIYSDTYGGELCLKNNEYDVSIEKIKDYFGFTNTGDNAWTNVHDYVWKYSNEPSWCEITDSNFSCTFGPIKPGRISAYSNGMIESYEFNTAIDCYVNNDNSNGCYYNY